MPERGTSVDSKLSVRHISGNTSEERAPVFHWHHQSCWPTSAIFLGLAMGDMECLTRQNLEDGPAFGAMVQAVKRLPLKQGAMGSSPTSCIIDLVPPN